MQVKKALQFILPGSPIFDYIEGLAPRPVSVYQELAQMAEKEETERINKEISARRFRLGAKQSQVSLEVQREVYLKSQLEELYKNIIDWAEDEETRRKYDEKLLDHGYKKMVAFPAEHKEAMRLKVQDWAQGLVILKHPFDRAWRIVLEWTDLEELGGFDVNILHEYIAFFPKSGLSQVLWAFLRSALSPFPLIEEEEGDEEEEEGETKEDDGKVKEKEKEKEKKRGPRREKGKGKNKKKVKEEEKEDSTELGDDPLASAFLVSYQLKLPLKFGI